MGFGLLSVVLGKLSFAMPGTETTSDFREIAFFIALFHIRTPLPLLLMSALTYVDTQFLPFFLITFSIHFFTYTALFYFMPKVLNRIQKNIPLGIVWFLLVVVFFNLVITPLYVGAFSLIQEMQWPEFFMNCKNFARNLRYETSTTAAITSLYLINTINNKRITKQNADLVIAKNIAEHNEKLKTAFLQNLSHEVRTPLNGIMGFVSLLTSDDIDEQQRAMFNKLIIGSSNQLMHIVQDIVDISQIETQQLKREKNYISLGDLVEKAKNDLEEKLESQEIIFQYFPKNCHQTSFECDDYKLDRIFKHLLSNAIKFGNDKEIRVFLYLSDSFLKIIVKDQGIGIPEENLPKVFSRFWQGERGFSRQYGGNGLGLAIIRGFVQYLGGNVSINSEIEKGTTVEVKLPLN